MSTFSELPEDKFGLHVANLRDEQTLLWLVNKIGEAKVRVSASKRGAYPESPLFVSTIVKRFGLKVPNEIFSEKRVKIARLYLLVLKDLSAVKVGVTSDWPGRAYAFVKNKLAGLEGTFDLKKSIAIELESMAHARTLEKSLLMEFSGSQVPSPVERGLIPYFCGGHSEWLSMSAYDDLHVKLGTTGVPRSLELHVNGEAAMINFLGDCQ
jgi:hypothetical protein